MDDGRGGRRDEARFVLFRCGGPTRPNVGRVAFRRAKRMSERMELALALARPRR